MISKFAASAAHFFLLIFAACVLGLSIKAVRWQYRNSVPSTNAYACFTGAFGCLVGLIGLMAVFMESIAGLAMAIVDGLAAVFFLAGAVAYVVGLSGAKCGNADDTGTWFNKLINGGCSWNEGEQLWYCSYRANSDLLHRCHMLQADSAFLVLGAIASLLAATLCLLAMRSRKKVRPAV